MFKYVAWTLSFALSLALGIVQGNEMKKNIAPYGKWKSPITVETLTEKLRSAGDVVIQNGQMYWSEYRPSEQGRYRIVTYAPDGQQVALTPDDVSVRTKVYEYGGKSFAVDKEGRLFYVNFKDQHVYMIEGKNPPKLITNDQARYADFLVTPAGLVAVAELHTPPDTTDYRNVKNYLTLIDVKNGAKILEEGHDFYSSPTLSPDGSKLAWLTWDHPNMPWDGTELWVADFNNGHLTNKKKVAGGSSESIFQPSWSPSGQLYFVSDKTGWWNIYRLQDGMNESVYPLEAEFGMPQWNLGSNLYAFTGRDDEIICIYDQNGKTNLALLNTKTKTLTPLDLGFVTYASPKTGPGYVVLAVGSYTEQRKHIKLDLNTLKWVQVGPPSTQFVDKGYISIPQFIKYPSADGRQAYAFYYPPTNKDYQAPENSKPPLLVTIHGGPTASTIPALSLATQFWTSRGFAVLDVDYGGSTGYGRAYRDLLKGKWGIVDVQDSENGARYLIERGLVDPKNIFIRGGSAGGYTTLAALAFTKTFSGGASYFGVSDLELLDKDTHKFEAKYTTQLIGPYPEALKLYEARSPIYHAREITTPVIFFQGAEDRIVPQNQAETMYNALKQNNVPTELIIYPGEGHGFRQPENIHDSTTRELHFYQNLMDKPKS